MKKLIFYWQYYNSLLFTQSIKNKKCDCHGKSRGFDVGRADIEQVKNAQTQISSNANNPERCYRFDGSDTALPNTLELFPKP